MTEIDVAKLRSLAEGATPGPWEAVEDSNEHLAGCPPTMEWLVSATDPGEDFYEEIIDWGNRGRGEDAQYIAAANPATILALLDRLEQAEAEVEHWTEGWIIARLTNAEAAIERVRALAERNGVTPWTEAVLAALDTGKEKNDE